MRVISVPKRLRLAGVILWACIPLAAVEGIIALRAPWWKLPFKTMAISAAVMALCCIPLSHWLVRAKRWALTVLAVFSLTWCFFSAYLAVQMANPGLGFFTFFLTAFLLGLFAWYRFELNRACLNPRMRWYQGLPRPVPGLSCAIGDQELRVSHLDNEGAFVFSQVGAVPEQRARSDNDLLFKFKDRQVLCRAVPVSVLSSDRGAGFQFQRMSVDGKKVLVDFVEFLKGEGHA